MSTAAEQNKVVIRRFFDAWNNRQPDEFEIATTLTLEAPRRLHLVEVAVEIQPQHRRRMIAGPPRRFRFDVEAVRRHECVRLQTVVIEECGVLQGR